MLKSLSSYDPNDRITAQAFALGTEVRERCASQSKIEELVLLLALSVSVNVGIVIWALVK
jgi:hypothetical protein